MADLSQSKENDAERIFLDFLEAFVGFIVIFLAQSSTSPFPMPASKIKEIVWLDA
jgi:hypothetical protein